jgi:hypothetical protein
MAIYAMQQQVRRKRDIHKNEKRINISMSPMRIYAGALGGGRCIIDKWSGDTLKCMRWE